MAISRHSKPRIIVTGPERGGVFAWLCTWLAVRRAGGKPVRVTPATSRKPVSFDGLIIGGGADVDPGLYGEQPSVPRPERERPLLRWLLALIIYPLLFLARRLFSTKHYRGLDKERDALEYRLLASAIRDGKPVLGICRGAQLLNVYLSGDLHQDISSFYTESPQVWSILPRKTIRIVTNSHLNQVLKTTTCRVNALHNQSINRLGRDLIISACETNGVVQAIEASAADYLIGVQWHPEYLPHIARQQYLFRGLVAAAQQSGEN